MNHTLFISDLHLSAERLDIAQCFFDFIRDEAPQADALYILGDLFEVWLGDDHYTPFNDQVARSIASLSQSTPVYFIHGNRDFAIGKKFAQKCNMTLLPEKYMIDLYGKTVLICHGDEFCTLDKAYMKFRKKTHSWWWLKLMLSLPLSLRKKFASIARNKSKKRQKGLPPEIMDVTKQAVDDTLHEYRLTTIIHGHTHRPKIHEFTLNDKPAKRIVLGDWYQQGSVLVAQKDKFELQSREFNQNMQRLCGSFKTR